MSEATKGDGFGLPFLGVRVRPLPEVPNPFFFLSLCGQYGYGSAHTVPVWVSGQPPVCWGKSQMQRLSMSGCVCGYEPALCGLAVPSGLLEGSHRCGV